MRAEEHTQNRKVFNKLTMLVATLCVFLLLPQFFCSLVHGGTIADPGIPIYQAQTLGLNGSLKRDIKGGQIHSYTFSLVSDQYVQLVVRRHGIDLTINVTTPDQTVRKFENPAGPESPLIALIKAERSRTYNIEVVPLKKWLPQGHYEIELNPVQAPNSIDENRLLAQEFVAEGRQQQRQETNESRGLALVSYEKALKLWEEVSDTFEAANTSQLMAQTYKALRDLEKADLYFKKALELRLSDRHSLAYTTYERADAYYSLKSPRASLPMYQETLTAFRDVGNKRGEALVLSQIGLVYMRLFDWDEARKTLETALAIHRAEADVYEEMRVLNALGGVADNQGQPERAMELFDQARAGFHALGDLAREGNMYVNIGLHHDTWGEWREAIDSYQKALELLEAGLAKGDADQLYVNSKKASVFYNLGALYVCLANYEEGRKYLQKSLDLRAANERGGTLSWFAYAAVLEKKPEEALKFCDQALLIQEPAKDPRRAQTYTIMGMAYHDLGRYDRAVEYFDLAFRIQSNEATSDRKGLAVTLDRRAAAYAAKGELANAREDLQRALTQWRTFKDPSGEAMSLFQLAQLERDSGNVETGLALAASAIKLIEMLRKNVNDYQLRASYFATKVDYYDAYIDLLMLSRGRSNVAETTSAAFEASEQRLARVLLETLSDADLAKGLLANPTLSSIVKRQRFLRRSILTKSALRTEAALKAKTADVDAFDEEITSLLAEQSRLESQISSQFREYAALTFPQPLSTKKVQQELDADTLLLEIALGEKRSYAWVVTPDEVRGFELPPRQAIESVTTRLLQALTARTREEPNETFQQQTLRHEKADKEAAEAATLLSKMVLEPVGALLGQKRLVIVADGTLQLVPFGVLPEPANSPIAMSTPTILIKNRDVISLPSASVLALQRRKLANRKPAPLSIAVIADPVFDIQDERVIKAISSGDRYRKESASSVPSKTSDKALASALRDVGLDPSAPLPRLLKSRTEALEIFRVVPGEQFQGLDFKASRSTVTNGTLGSYRYVHFATHGLLDLEHPELSGIALSMFDEKGNKQDGYLRLYDIYNLNLPAELVVLSGCQTGIGRQVKGEGLIALTRGFMYAGAARVVASLWKVDDSATAELMAQFYKEMFKNGKRPAAALRAAQIHLSQQKRWKSPHYWAGFVLQGEWR